MYPSFSKGIDHIHVYVSDREKAANWYGDMLGFRTVKAFEVWAEDAAGPLTIADADNAIHLALFHADDPKPVSLAFGVSANEYQEWQSHLDAKSVKFVERDHDLSRSIYFNDPFANQIEITTYEI